MRVVVNAEVCQGHTLCNMVAPDIFHLREEDGHAVVVVGGELSAEQEPLATRPSSAAPNAPSPSRSSPSHPTCVNVAELFRYFDAGSMVGQRGSPRRAKHSSTLVPMNDARSSASRSSSAEP